MVRFHFTRTELKGNPYFSCSQNKVKNLLKIQNLDLLTWGMQISKNGMDDNGKHPPGIPLVNEDIRQLENQAHK